MFDCIPFKMSKQEITGQRPTWAEIDLDALAHNLRVIRQRVGREMKVLAAVKANAYGHGAVEWMKPKHWIVQPMTPE